MEKNGARAVVLGASIAGLLSARVLADHYDRVTVVERDLLPDSGEPRRGVPQGGQPHLMLARCGQIVEELFPGILDEMHAAGAYRWDEGDLSSFHVYFGGHRLVQTGRLPEPASLVNYFATRPFIEAHIRRRLRALANVTVLDGHDIVDLVGGQGRVTGVRVARGDLEVTLLADLVVDATGRGSRTPVFLDRLGYGRPDVDELAVRVAYASMPLRIPDGTLHEKLILRLFEPGRPRGFAMSQCEHDVWTVMAATLGDVPLPRTLDEIVDFGVDSAPLHALHAARVGTALGDIRVHRYPCNRWRRYDTMAATPAGLLVVGDAFCSFNPIYGQGMTVAAIESMILRDCLSRGGVDLPRRFFKAAAKRIRTAWQTAVGSDLALPEIDGPRPVSMRVTNAYLDRVLSAAETDTVVAQEFLRVMGMVEPPSRLMRPSFVARVLRAGSRHGAQAAELAPVL